MEKIIHSHIPLKDSDTIFFRVTYLLTCFVPNFTNFLSITLWLHDFKRNPTTTSNIKHGSMLPCDFWALDFKFRFILKLPSNITSALDFFPLVKMTLFNKKGWQQQKTTALSQGPLKTENDFTKYHPKFNIAPEKLPKPKRKGLSSNSNFSGVNC